MGWNPHTSVNELSVSFGVGEALVGAEVPLAAFPSAAWLPCFGAAFLLFVADGRADFPVTGLLALDESEARAMVSATCSRIMG